MNKVLKGTIAAGAAVALFGGGAGSLAYWQASESTDELTLQMGHVQLMEGAKTYYLNGDEVTYETLNSYDSRLVPGDVVTYNHRFGIDVATGADTVLNVADLEFENTPQFVLDAIETDLTVSVVEEWSENLTFSATNEARSFNVSGRGLVEVTVTVAVPADHADSETMVYGISLKPLPVTLTQVAEPLPDAVG
ncbi:alternate-type signal peptide domain-containing protein [Microbacterium sp. HA-8]|jgi:alternate signal-mediated exported protein|uniref:alternate-type signal peptide domain-containing protein n=1 Tax=Microbacterium sp. HA-8 TaxID=3234200 RepID=UPI0038F5F965